MGRRDSWAQKVKTVCTFRMNRSDVGIYDRRSWLSLGGYPDGCMHILFLSGLVLVWISFDYVMENYIGK